MGGEDTKLNLLEHWSQFTPDHVFLWQEDTNLYSEDDADSSDWLYSLLLNSTEDDLNVRVDEEYDALPVEQRGGIVRLKLMLSEMFFMSQDVVGALQAWAKNFATVGVTKIPGENVALGAAQFEVVAVRLADVNQLPVDAPI